MAPNVTSSPSGVLYEEDLIAAENSPSTETKGDVKPKPKFKKQIVWPNVIMHLLLHIGAVYGAYLTLTSAKLLTGIWAFFLYEVGILGITGGAHRLWSHRSYKAKWPMRVILMICQTVSFQTSVHEWARNHRVHHKHSDTDGDPHNVNRGLFFSHAGWMMCRKHPEVKEKGKQIDVSDLDADPIVRFQKKYYLILMPLMCFILPTWIPVYFWGETWHNSYFVAAIFRHVFTLNMTLMVNSVTHNTMGNRPYDRNINPAENIMVSLMTLGEGWHNYHHVFPWDYKTAELGTWRVNMTTIFIDLCAKIGWAYDLKTVPNDMVKRRVERTGDGTHEIWGWGDKDMTKKEKEIAQIINKKD